MSDFRNDKGSGEGNFGKRRFGSDRGGDRKMFTTTCSNCGKSCEVPFNPTSGKPVYCNDCFRTMGGSNTRRPDDRGPRKPSFSQGGGGSAHPQYKEQFEALNAKLDKILGLLGQEVSQKQPKAAKPATKEVVVETKTPEAEIAEVEKIVEELEAKAEQTVAEEAVVVEAAATPEKKKRTRKKVENFSPLE